MDVDAYTPPVRTLTLATVVAAMLLTPSAASAEPTAEDWRAAACADQGTVEDAPTGASTLVASSRVPVDGLPGVQVGIDRLDFSGVSCEVLYVDGALPRGAAIDVTRNSLCSTFAYALDGKESGEGEGCSSLAGPIRLYTSRTPLDLPEDVEVLSIQTFRGQDSEVLQAEPGMPPRLIGKTRTTTHTGSSWRVRLRSTTQTRREFDRSRATDRAARLAYPKQVARATRAYEARVARINRSDYPRLFKDVMIREAAADRKESVALARKKQRLALDGVRLVVRESSAGVGGTLGPAA